VSLTGLVGALVGCELAVRPTANTTEQQRCTRRGQHATRRGVLVLRCAEAVLLACVCCVRRCPALESLSLAQCGNLFDFHDDAWQVSTHTCLFSVPACLSRRWTSPVIAVACPCLLPCVSTHKRLL
jgi:hypothetical protein